MLDPGFLPPPPLAVQFLINLISEAAPSVNLVPLRSEGGGEEGEEEEEETDGFKNAGTVRHRHAHKKGTQDCMHTLLVVLLLLYSS